MQLLTVAAVGCTVPSAAAAQLSGGLGLTSVSPPHVGWVGLEVSGRPGSAVTLSERLNGVTAPFRTVTLSGSRVTIARALPWRCDRRVRQLEADAADPP